MVGGFHGLTDKTMPREKVSKLVAATLVATFAFGSMACYPAFQPNYSLFAMAALGSSDDSSDDDRGRPLPRSPLAEDISERPLSELIHPRFDCVMLRSAGLDARPPVQLMCLYSMLFSSELLRPPQV